MIQMTDQIEATATEPSINTKLAYERTNLAHERTLMAWVRTATSLITFGFTIYKFFQLEMSVARVRPQQLIGPREFAILMIAIGLIALMASTIQHWQSRRDLRKQYTEVPRSLAALVAGLISLLGMVAIIAVIFRM
jgi:putative membrane protein